jgi:hypothetical protein
VLRRLLDALIFTDLLRLYSHNGENTKKRAFCIRFKSSIENGLRRQNLFQPQVTEAGSCDDQLTGYKLFINGKLTLSRQRIQEINSYETLDSGQV